MTKRIIALSLLFLFIAGGWSLLLAQQSGTSRGGLKPGPDNLIRLHILANSDSPADQELKLKVRDAVVEYLAPVLDKATTVNEARQAVNDRREDILQVAHQVIVASGADYPVSMEIGRFDFPVRSYGTLVLPDGNYEAARILIGKAEGKNWWCVLFPPLCFVDATTAVAVPATTDFDKAETKSSSSIHLKWKVAELWQDTVSKP